MTDEVRFTDSHGVPWMAREVPASRITFGDELVEERPAHLRFEPLADGAGPPRTGRHYPQDWHALPAVELETLLEEAEPVVAEHANADADAELRRHLSDLST